MAKELRVRCVMCGMMPELWRIRETMQKLDAEIQIFEMTIGGRRKGEYKIDRKGKYRLVSDGIIDYNDVTANQRELLLELKVEILDQIEKIRSLMESIA